MNTLTLAGLGIAAGLHGALYGAYKDSPHESFRWRRSTRGRPLRRMDPFPSRLFERADPI